MKSSNYWIKSLEVAHNRTAYTVVCLFDGIGNDSDKERVLIKSFANEYLLESTIYFDNRDDAYMFIRHFSIEYAKEWLLAEYVGQNGETLK